MRITLNLDDDVDAFLRERMRLSGASFKVELNKYLLLGLQEEAITSPLPQSDKTVQ